MSSDRQLFNVRCSSAVDPQFAVALTLSLSHTLFLFRDLSLDPPPVHGQPVCMDLRAAEQRFPATASALHVPLLGGRKGLEPSDDVFVPATEMARS